MVSLPNVDLGGRNIILIVGKPGTEATSCLRKESWPEIIATLNREQMFRRGQRPESLDSLRKQSPHRWMIISIRIGAPCLFEVPSVVCTIVRTTS